MQFCMWGFLFRRHCTHDACVILITTATTNNENSARNPSRPNGRIWGYFRRQSIMLSKTQQPTLAMGVGGTAQNLFNSVSLVYRHSLPAHICFLFFVFYDEIVYKQATIESIRKSHFRLGLFLLLLLFSFFFLFRIVPRGRCPLSLDGTFWLISAEHRRRQVVIHQSRRLASRREKQNKIKDDLPIRE